MAAATGWQQSYNQPLPPGWEAKFDPGLQRYYFINHTTKTTTWKDPRFAVQEEVPMQNLRQPTQPSASAPKARSPHSKKQKQRQKPATQETSFTVDEPLVDLPKEISDAEKEQIKKRLIKLYPGVDDGVIQVALVAAKYNEAKAKQLVKELKGDDDDQEAKRREVRRKKRERERKEREQEEKDRQRKQIEEQLEQEKALERERAEAERRSSTASTFRSAGSTPVSVTQVSLLVGDKGRSDSLRTNTGPSASDFIVDDTGRSGIDKFTMGSGSITALISKPKSAAKVKKEGKLNTRPKANVISKDKFASHLRGDYQGPNRQLHVGSNPDLLIPQWVQAMGPQSQNRKGPQRTSRRGPAPRDTRKMPLNCGPQANLRCGPQSNNVAGAMYAPSFV